MDLPRFDRLALAGDLTAVALDHDGCALDDHAIAARMVLLQDAWQRTRSAGGDASGIAYSCGEWNSARRIMQMVNEMLGLLRGAAAVTAGVVNADTGGG